MSDADPLIAQMNADLERLLTSGVRRSRFRIVEIVCPHQHEIASVYRLASGRALVYYPVVEVVNATGGPVKRQRRVDMQLVAVDESDSDAWAIAANRCCALRVELEWLREQMAAHRARVALGA